jgi:soluble lytic murein transglycosylase-like protein
MSQTLALPQSSARLSEFVIHFIHGGLLSIGLVALLIAGSSLLAGDLHIAVRNIFGTELVATQSAMAQGDATQEEATPAGIPPAAVTAKVPAQLNATAEVIAKRYRVALPAVVDIAQTVHRHARAAGFDPMLVLAIIGVESRFNPYAESSFGAQGLMQIIGRFHTDKFRPTSDGAALLDPETNIRVGVAILREYIGRTGSIDLALKIYGGETDDSGIGYAERVMAEKERLEAAVKRVSRG